MIRTLKGPKSFAANAVLVTLSLAVSIVGAEIVYRVYHGISLLEMRDFHPNRNRGDLAGINEYDPLLGWKLRPSASFRGIPNHAGLTYDITTIDHGIRRNSSRSEYAENGAVLVVGDSFAVGSEVNDHETWPAQLEEIILQRVLNAAAGGWGTDQMIMRAETLLPLVAPKAVIVAFLDQDILRAGFSSYGRPKPFFDVQNGRLVHRNLPVPIHVDPPSFAIGKLRASLAWSAAANDLMTAAFPSLWLGAQGQQFRTIGNDPVEVTCRLLHRLKTELDSRNIAGLLLMQYGEPVRRLYQRPDDARLVIECADLLGYYVVDEYSPMRNLALGNVATFESFFVHPRDRSVFGHMSNRGNAFVASLVAPTLERALSSGPRTTSSAWETRFAPVGGDQLRVDLAERLSRQVGLFYGGQAPIASLAEKDTGQFVVAAVGPVSEHYVIVPAPEIKHSHAEISLEFRTSDRTWPRFQLLDRQNNGVFADIDPRRPGIALHRLGNAVSLRGSVRHSANGWVRVSFSSSGYVDEGHLIIQLATDRGPVFSAENEHLEIRRAFLSIRKLMATK